MPDISMCAERSCPVKEKCYRWLAMPNKPWQSYIRPQPGPDGCSEFWPVEDELENTRELRKERK